MIAVAIIVSGIVVLGIVAIVFLGGYSIGASSETAARVQGVRRHAMQAEREVHDLARQTFISMTEAVDRRRLDQ